MRLREIAQIRAQANRDPLSRLVEVEHSLHHVSERLDRVERSWVKPNELAALISRAKVYAACVLLGAGGVLAGCLGTLWATGSLR